MDCSLNRICVSRLIALANDRTGQSLETKGRGALKAASITQREVIHDD
ncbi:MAG: hypothetical protein P8N63_01075 [Pseudomonadales bacterium]|nr:hypothetical protein [Pseudomonadales bacterium]|tara:strand:- start:314 stop:457 length:144 start_codon:yes stop_codon:yes gene_type:complete